MSLTRSAGYFMSERFIDQQLRRFALERYGRFGSMSLSQLYASADIFCDLPDSYVEFLVQHRQPVLDWLNSYLSAGAVQTGHEVLAFFADRMTYFIHRKNQFIVVGQEERDDLIAVYDTFLSGYRDALLTSSRKVTLADKLEQVMVRHQLNLVGFTHDLVSSNVGLVDVFSEAVCSEYSPALQLSLLQTEPEHMLEPILDLGCGEEAHLVHYLRERGKLAFGLDRLVAAGSYLLKADWLDYPLEQHAWGTIISHMGFSNHFLHHHLRRNGHPERYARRYMEILGALRPGGSFVYTPGVPFVEDLLPQDAYAVQRFTLSALSGSSIDASLQARLGQMVLYSCRVTRLPKL